MKTAVLCRSCGFSHSCPRSATLGLAGQSRRRTLVKFPENYAKGQGLRQRFYTSEAAIDAVKKRRANPEAAP